MKMCAALARRGHEVRLVAKHGDEASCYDDHEFYGVERNFVVEKIKRPPFRGGGAFYAAGMTACVARRRRWADLVYCRDPLGALIAAQAGLPVAFEAHDVPTSWWLRTALTWAMHASSAVGMIAISHALRRDLEDAGIQPAERRLVVAHDACDPPTRNATRRVVGGSPVIGYVGGLYPGRGVELIVALAREMPRCRFRLVGGTEADLRRWRAEQLPPNVEMLGFRPQRELRDVYDGFDIVVMPYAVEGVVGPTGRGDTSRWASPMKMFEYMASGVAIVSSNLPVLREVLRDGENAAIVRDSSVTAWRLAIERLLADVELRFRLASTAQFDLMREYTWDARAASVIDGLGLGH